jgi:hypothetical protein
VVESADLRHCHDIAALGMLDRACLGRVLPESEMRARGVIVADVIARRRGRRCRSFSTIT